MTTGSGFYVSPEGIRECKSGQLTPSELIAKWRECLRWIAEQYPDHGCGEDARDALALEQA